MQFISFVRVGHENVGHFAILSYKTYPSHLMIWYAFACMNGKRNNAIYRKTKACSKDCLFIKDRWHVITLYVTSWCIESGQLAQAWDMRNFFCYMQIYKTYRLFCFKTGNSEGQMRISENCHRPASLIRKMLYPQVSKYSIGHLKTELIINNV
jgi:hypothetical protein